MLVLVIKVRVKSCFCCYISDGVGGGIGPVIDGSTEHSFLIRLVSKWLISKWLVSNSGRF